jgi:hypothetical protein
MTRVSEQSREILYGGSLEVFEIKLCKLPELVPKMGIPGGMNRIMKAVLGNGELNVLPTGVVLQFDERNSPTCDLEGDFVLLRQFRFSQSSPSNEAIKAAPSTTPKIASAARKKS